jgi:hypothetical protein
MGQRITRSVDNSRRRFFLTLISYIYAYGRRKLRRYRECLRHAKKILSFQDHYANVLYRVIYMIELIRPFLPYADIQLTTRTIFKH